MARKTQEGGHGAEDKRLLYLRELPKVYGCSIWWWRSRIWRGEIPAIKLGGKYLIDRRDIERLIEQQKVTAAA